MLTRRSFLTRSSLASGAVVGVIAPHVARSTEALLASPGQRPKRIIHVVSDGMSIGTLTCADAYSQLTRKRRLAWTELWNHPAARSAVMNTRSLNSLVTDSSAASSAWGSGSRVVNGAVNALPNGALLTPLYTLFAAAGWKTGLVTTAEITHATPAGFATAVTSRGDAEDIAVQYFERKVDILLGGGRPYFSPNRRRDKRDLRGDFTRAGYRFVATQAELAAAPLDAPVLGTFADGHLPYTIDHRADPKLVQSVPTLADLTRAALARLERSDKFILQVEGARIDHAAHNSDAAAAIHEQIALDEALVLVLEFQQRHPDTLIVCTTDHANSNLGLNGMGGGYGTTSQRFAMLSEIKMSFPGILKRFEQVGEPIKIPAIPTDPEDRLDVQATNSSSTDRTKFTAAVQMASALRVEPAKIIDIIAETTGYRMSLRRAELFAKVLAGTAPQLFDQMNSPVTQLGQLLGNRLGIGWTGNTHTADYVQLTAIGPGSERFTGLMENTDVFRHYTALAGIDFKNPTAPLIAHAGPESDDAEGPARYRAMS
jgi:alkaline phosphatase